jgi:creatinine amidohydrolase
MQKSYKYEEMLPDEFQEAVGNMPVFFIPTGLLEWHGDHLPFGQDALKAYGICLKTAEKLGGGVVLPPNYYGRPGFSSYTGTLTFSEACMDLLFTELFGQLKKVGAKVIVVLTGHYGPLQVDFIKRVADYYMKENPEIKIIAQPEYEGVTVNGETPADHAGKWETSMFWYFYPELTRMDKFRMETAKKKIYDNPPNDYYKEEEDWVWKEDLTKTSSRELGEKCVNIITDYLVEKIRSQLK